MRAMRAAARTAAVVAAVAGAFSLARGEEPPPAAGPVAPKRIDHPLAKALDGEWAVASTSAVGKASGVTTFRLGLGGTALLQDYALGQPADFHGHGVWRISDDGKTVRVWWFDTRQAAAQVFEGTLSADGYDVKDADSGVRLTLSRKGEGFEFRLHPSDGSVLVTDSYSRR
jgi:hypothetical protein